MNGVRALLLGVAIVALTWLGSLGTQQLAPAYPGIAPEITGTFIPEGHYPGEPLFHGEALRKWGSFAGDDAHTGTLALGPFPAPARLRFGVSGHPATKPNGIALELVASGAQEAIPIVQDIGLRWNVVDFDVPPAWVGQPVRLIARDGVQTSGGWVGITEPLHGGRGERLNGFRETLAAWTLNGGLLGVLWLAALRGLRRCTWLPAFWHPLFAAALVATAGYAAFWIYFAHAATGKVFSALLIVGAVVAVARIRTGALLDGDARRVAKFAVAVGLFYVTLLHLFPSSREFDALAANRFRENLPGDNTLPHNLASTLYQGLSPRAPGAEWQSSDRPPLQTGWLLLTWPFHRALGFEERVGSGTAAVWFQLLWLPAAFGSLCALGMAARRAAAWTGVLALSGFFLQHTVFTWPKLSAAAFACGALGLWTTPATGAARSRLILAGGALAALGWLSHGGVAFAYIALAPWLLWRALRGEMSAWLRAAGAFLLFALPWTAYQKLYEPPANMLLQNHLAGIDARDPRGTWPAIRDAYRDAPWAETLARKRANFAVQFGGSYRALLDISAAGAPARRHDEFFHTGRALGWWLLGIPLCALALLRGGARRDFRTHAAGEFGLLAWVAGTVVVWCLLMFHGGQAVIHQGSYTILLSLFVLLSRGCERAGSWAIFVVAALQAVVLATTYGISNSLVRGPAVGLPVVVLAALALLFAIVSEIRARPPKDTFARA